MSPQYRLARRLVAAAFAVTAISTSVVGGSEGANADPAPVYNGEIVFMRYGPNTDSVRTVRPDGTNEHPVNAGAYPTFTPDGSQIVSLAFGGIATTSTAGGLPFQKLPGSGGGFSMAVSPDGQRVIWTRFSEGIINEALDGSDRKVLFAGLPNSEGGATFLPNGRIAYSRWSGSEYEIWTADADGTNAALALPNAGSRFAIDVSPDGSKVAFGSGDGVVIAALDGSSRVVVGPANAGIPRFSPDGDWLVFGRDGDDPGISVMRTDGSQLQQLTHGYDEFADWQPRTTPLPAPTPIYNGRIAFDRDGPADGDEQFLSVNADGSDSKAFPTFGAWAQYSSDGTKISYCAAQGLVYVADADGTDPVHLDNVECSGWGWSWSPDGTRFAGSFAQLSPTPGPHTIATWTMTGERTDLFADDDEQEMWPRYTPSGELVFGRNNGFWASPADGSDQQLLFTRGSDIRSPMLVENGTKAAWVEGVDLWVADIDGEHPQQIASNVSYPAPSPDGQSIAFGNYTDPAGIYVVNIDGTGLHQVTSGPDYFPTWQPLSAPPNQPPVPRFTKFAQVTGHYVVARGNTSSDPDGTIVKYEWRWGDGTTPGTGPQAWHKYKKAGYYLIRLTVTDDDGASTTRGVWYHVN